jgi:CBS domain-containing protein
MIVSQLMTTDVLSASPSMSLKEVAALLAASGVSGLPVVEDGEVVGVISEADILMKERGPAEHRRFHRHHESPKTTATTVAEAMTAPAVTISPRRHVDEVARLMTDRKINRLPVVDHGKLVGIVTRADLVRAFTRTDSEIEHEIREDVLVRTFWLTAGELEVKVDDGAVTLRGTLDTKTLSELLPRFVQAVPGVVSVDADIAWRVDDRKEAAAPVI